MSKKTSRSKAAADESTYKIGYGKPPLHSRWRQGQSGNKDGRRKNSLNLQTIAAMLADELAELVSVQGPEGKRKVSKQHAFFKKLINDALTGGARDKKLLLEAMLKLTDAQASVDEGFKDEALTDAFNVLQHYVERASRRRTKEGSAPQVDDDEDDYKNGEGSP